MRVLGKATRWGVAAILAGAATAAAAELGSARGGAMIANAICAECHVVSDAQTHVGLVALPSLQETANNPERTETWLRAFMVTPHFEMPDFVFTPDQLDDLIAYMRSLRE
jgi:mono/diheme cytochrome c family protein